MSDLVCHEMCAYLRTETKERFAVNDRRSFWNKLKNDDALLAYLESVGIDIARLREAWEKTAERLYPKQWKSWCIEDKPHWWYLDHTRDTLGKWAKESESEQQPDLTSSGGKVFTTGSGTTKKDDAHSHRRHH